jgi:TonB family protein
MLGTITDFARQMTGASGAALVMWKEGVMVCRARSGEMAPLLGAPLNAKAGISGECLRTGKIQHCTDTENDPLVDLEVCRSLGLRSIAVLPIRGWRGINGILEVFSAKPAAFTERHIALLQQLAALADRARTSQPESASAAAPKLPSEIEKPPSGAPPSIRVADVAQAFRGTRSRPVVLGATGFGATALLALAIWLGWRALERADVHAHAAPSSASPANVSTATPDAAVAHLPDRPPDNDPVWKANPGGELINPSTVSPATAHKSNDKPSAGSPVKLASNLDVLVGNKKQTERASAGDVAANVVITHGNHLSETEPNAGARTGSHTNLPSDATTSSEPLSISEGAAGQSPLNGVLSAKASLPGLSIPVSQGVSGGQLVYRVPPAYPAQARLQRLEGRVVLAAVIMEDGTLRDVRVIEGELLLAQAAVDAVRHWRYKPYELDGKPVKNLIRINVDFKIPGAAPR